MPRKSKELRLSQTKSLIDEYTAAGIGHSDRCFRFMNDMVLRLDRGKSLSTGQRNYLDRLIDQGVPALKNQERVQEILDASEVDGMQEVAGILRDFAYKVGKGWSLSEKQESFLAKLIHKSIQLKATGRFRPSSDLVEDLATAVSILRYKNSYYWQHRVGTAKAYEKVTKWLRWHHSKCALDNIDNSSLENRFYLEEEPIIDQWSCDKIVKTVKNQLEELKNPKHLTGAIAWIRPGRGSQKVLGLISGEPTVQKGVIVYPFLCDGEDILVPSSDLKKRR